MADIPITVGFGGGAELLFGNKKSYSVSLPGKEKEWVLGDLIFWIKDNLLKERPELFIQDDSVRPGILVLVNDADWELMKCKIFLFEMQPRQSFSLLPISPVTPIPGNDP